MSHRATHRYAASVLASIVILTGNGASATECPFATGLTRWASISIFEVGGPEPSCTPNDTMTFVVPDGATVEVMGDLVFDPGASGGIRVEAGGTLIVDARVNQMATILAVGGYGLRCEAGSDCRFTNGYRSAALDVPDLIDEPDDDAQFFVDQIVPCDEDCSTTPQLARFEWANPGAVLRGSINAIDPGDVLCFYDPDPLDLDVGVDSGFCYDVVDASGETWGTRLVIDVRQGEDDPDGFPHQRRQIKQVGLASGAAAGHGPSGWWDRTPSPSTTST